MSSRAAEPALALGGFEMVNRGDLSVADRRWLADVFQKRVFPLLMPLAVDSTHPFPSIADASLHLAVTIAGLTPDQPRLAVVEVPALLPRLIRLMSARRFILLEEVVVIHLAALFPDMEIVDHHYFRVWRDPGRGMRRLQRLEVDADIPADVLSRLLQGLRMDAKDVSSMPETSEAVG